MTGSTGPGEGRVDRLPAAILACVQAAGKTYTHVLAPNASANGRVIRPPCVCVEVLGEVLDSCRICGGTGHARAARDV